MPKRGWLTFKVTVLVVSISIVLASCQAPGIFPDQTPTPVSDNELFISAAVQKTLNDYNTALEKNDRTLFMSTIDQGEKTLQEAAQSSFDFMEGSGYVKTVKLGMTLNSIEQINQELVLAHIRRDRDGWLADWYFRSTGDRWVISELYAKEVGIKQTTTTDNYTFVTYPVMDNLNKKIIPLLSKAQEHVRKDLGEVPTGKVEISIYPSSAISPIGCSSSGWDISTTADSPDTIFILSPASWCSNIYDPQKGWEADIEMLLTHELAKITYIRNFGNPGKGVDWFFEGAAEYVAGYDEMPDVRTAVQNNSIIPIIDTSSAEKKMDLAHFANLDYSFLAYGLSESLVTFIIEKYGGLDTFLALARSYNKTQDMKTAIQDTLGLRYEDFDAAWRSWLKEDYINRN